MVQIYEIPWAAWYKDTEYKLEFPDSWDVKVYSMKDVVEINQIEIENAIKNPIGSPRLQEIARGKSNAVIVVEDLSRPTNLKKILDAILEELHSADIKNQNITLIYALGAHRPMNRQDSIKKLGREIVNQINIENHHPYENLVFIENSNKGTPIYLNKTYFNAEVKIAVGSVLPHPLAGFGGGAKLVLPGICGIQTLEANHRAGVRGIGIGLGIVTELRRDIEDVCGRVGLDFSVNIVNTIQRGIAGIFAGHFIEAHRKAIDLAKKVYYTKIPDKIKLDIGFFNLYPEDTEFSQSLKGLNLLLSSKSLIRRGGMVVLMTAASEGRGYHSLQGETGGKLYQNWGDTIIFKGILKKMNFGIFSPNINLFDILHYYPPRTIFKNDFQEMIKSLIHLYGNSPKIGIFPSSIQIG